MSITSYWLAEDFENELEKTLSSFPRRLQKKIMELIISDLEYEMKPAYEKKALHHVLNTQKTKYYVVSENDLHLVDSVAKEIILNWAISLLAHPAISIISSLVFYLWKYRRKGAEISWEAGIVLTALKNGDTNGSTIENLRENIDEKLNFSSRDIEEIMKNELQGIMLNDGSLLDIVQRINGKWKAIDV